MLQTSLSRRLRPDSFLFCRSATNGKRNFEITNIVTYSNTVLPSWNPDGDLPIKCSPAQRSNNLFKRTSQLLAPSIRMTVSNFQFHKFKPKRTVYINPNNYEQRIREAFKNKTDEELSKIIFVRKSGLQSGDFLVVENGKVMGFMSPLMCIPPPLSHTALISTEVVSVVGGVSVKQYLEALRNIGPEYKSFLMIVAKDGVFCMTFDKRGSTTLNLSKSLATPDVGGAPSSSMTPMMIYSRGPRSVLQEQEYYRRKAALGLITPSEERDARGGGLVTTPNTENTDERNVNYGKDIAPFRRRYTKDGEKTEDLLSSLPVNPNTIARQTRIDARMGISLREGMIDKYNMQACAASSFFDRFFDHMGEYFGDHVDICPTWWIVVHPGNDRLWLEMQVKWARGVPETVYEDSEGGEVVLSNEVIGGKNGYYREICGMNFLPSEERRWVKAPHDFFGHPKSYSKLVKGQLLNEEEVAFILGPEATQEEVTRMTRELRDNYILQPHNTMGRTDNEHDVSELISIEKVLSNVKQGFITLDH
eukprot:Tbor_TRINITY_DN4573_c0_g1::TRINITY_DN4573_c0_g1_i1::g.15881::m.15881